LDVQQFDLLKANEIIYFLNINVRIYCRSKGSIIFQTVSNEYPESRNIAPTNASNTSASALGAVESAH
jgi:hypothetical protein